MSLSRFYNDDYDDYDDVFDPMHSDRQARRKRKPKAKHTPKKTEREIIEEIADTSGIEGGFQTTYTPALYEAEWLFESLKTFYQEQMITDILAMVKGGKEASVYRCKAHPSTGLEYIAAKVYRPRKFRNLRNDALYREGRALLKSDSNEVQDKEKRLLKAVSKKSAFGEQLEHTSWLMYEYTTLKHLYTAGAAVPQPIASGDNAVLMSYIGDEFIAAPSLHETQIDPDEAEALFKIIMHNIELMLSRGLIHGDLSAFNILYWEGEITLIDFPQVVNSHTNSQAKFILGRDIERVCSYFIDYGVDCDPEAITNRLWDHYADIGEENRAADESRMLAEALEEDDDEY